MEIQKIRKNLPDVLPRHLNGDVFVRAYNTRMMTHFKNKYLFDNEWSYTRGYRYNFKNRYPVLYLAGDHLVASLEIGPRALDELFLSNLKIASEPYIYFSVKVTANVLDLTDMKIRRKLGITLKDILIPTEKWDKNMEKGIISPTHEIGELAFNNSRFDGILYPPYPTSSIIKLRGKSNLAIFMDRNSVSMSKPKNGKTVINVCDKGDVLKKLGLVY